LRVREPPDLANLKRFDETEPVGPAVRARNDGSAVHYGSADARAELLARPARLEATQIYVCGNLIPRVRGPDVDVSITVPSL
jgi:hypothetical protein